MATVNAESTPNPNSLKFTTPDGQFRKKGVAAFSSSDEADGDPLARSLFSIAGVEDVFITPDFVTVSKQSRTDWSETQSQITSALTQYLEERVTTDGH